MDVDVWVTVLAPALSALSALGGALWGGRISSRGAVRAVEVQIEAGRRDSTVADAVAWGGDLVGAAFRIRTMAETVGAMNRQPVPMSMGTVGRMVAEMAEAQESVMAARQRLRGLKVEALSDAADEIAEVVARSAGLMARQRWWEFLTPWRRDGRWAGITASLTTAIGALEAVIAGLSEGDAT